MSTKEKKISIVEDNPLNEKLRVPAIALRGLIVFPHDVIHFDVGREISINAIEKAMRGDRIIFLVPQTDLTVDDPTRKDIYDVGTVAKVRQVLKIAEDGVRVLVEGMWRAKVENFVTINNATFAEVTENEGDLVFLSNAKSVCDVVYFSLNFALVPLFVSLGLNIKIVALIFLPLALTMLIPLFMIKEDKAAIMAEKANKERTTVLQSIFFAFKDRPFIKWLFVLCIMNMGLQLFLSGINEYFSTTDVNMTFVMASCFVPVPFTILIYNKLVRKRGLGFAYRYILTVYSTGMALMGLCGFIPQDFLLPYAIMCSIIVSFAIGSFFSVTYTVPSQRALLRQSESKAASSMYFAIQGLFEAVSAGIATGGILVFLKQHGLVSYLTLIVAAFCMLACVLSFFLPKTITMMGKDEK